MDPEACLNILTQAQRDSGQDSGQPCRRPGQVMVCPYGSRTPPPQEDGGGDTSDPEVDNRPGSPTRINGSNDDVMLPPPHLGGQIIDLETGEVAMSAESLLTLFPDLRPDRFARLGSNNTQVEAEDGMQVEAEDGMLQAEERMKGLLPTELIAEVLQLHGERVRVHKAYDAAFHHLATGQGGGVMAVTRMYPVVVSWAAAHFKAQSEQVRAAASALEAGQSSEGTREAAALVRKLQSSEQSRLHLVADSHLHQTRRLQAVDEEEARRLQRLCNGLRQRVGATSEDIEETISELRYCAADLCEEMPQQ